jgi:NAD(P)-dependent dehydrogenase (short-subunit alcohol dehydrogenase family)
MMTKLFASRLAAESIAVYEVRPGVIRTEMTAAAKDRYDTLIAAGGIPMARWGEPEEIARTVAVLARGEIPYIGQSAYCASKAAVIHFSRVLALELSAHQVRVNSVCPGTTETPLIKQAILQEGPHTLSDRIHGSLELFRAGIPLRRIAQPDDIAATIAFLLSTSARHITGQAIFVDGGESIV